MEESNEQTELESEIGEATVQLLRERLQKDLNDSISDSDCTRFLKARCGNISKTEKMINDWWQWWRTPLPKMQGITPSNIILFGTHIEIPTEKYIAMHLPHSNIG